MGGRSPATVLDQPIPSPRLHQEPRVGGAVISASPGFWGCPPRTPQQTVGVTLRRVTGVLSHSRKTPKFCTFQRRRYIPGLAPSELPCRSTASTWPRLKPSARMRVPARVSRGTAGKLLGCSSSTDGPRGQARARGPSRVQECHK